MANERRLKKKEANIGRGSYELTKRLLNQLSGGLKRVGVFLQTAFLVLQSRYRFGFQEQCSADNATDKC